jgi:hypothetical protein
LTLDGQFSGLLLEIKSTRTGRQGNNILELFWTKIYNGYSVGEMDALQGQSFALNDYLTTFDELHE